MFPHQLRKEVRNEIRSDGRKHTDGECPEICILLFLDNLPETSGLIEYLFGLPDDGLPCFGGDDGLSAPVEDLDAQLIF